MNSLSRNQFVRSKSNQSLSQSFESLWWSPSKTTRHPLLGLLELTGFVVIAHLSDTSHRFDFTWLDIIHSLVRRGTLLSWLQIGTAGSWLPQADTVIDFSMRNHHSSTRSKCFVSYLICLHTNRTRNRAFRVFQFSRWIPTFWRRNGGTLRRGLRILCIRFFK